MNPHDHADAKADNGSAQYLERLQEQGDFAKGFNVSADHWTYAEFRGAMDVFRERYHLGSFTFKEIDKFLWRYGGDLP